MQSAKILYSSSSIWSLTKQLLYAAYCRMSLTAMCLIIQFLKVIGLLSEVCFPHLRNQKSAEKFTLHRLAVRPSCITKYASGPQASQNTGLIILKRLIWQCGKKAIILGCDTNTRKKLTGKINDVPAKTTQTISYSPQIRNKITNQSCIKSRPRY